MQQEWSSLNSEGFLLRFYRPQFWRLQKHGITSQLPSLSFIGHNFETELKTHGLFLLLFTVLSATILETTKPQMVAVCKPLGDPTLYEVKYSGLYFTWK